MSSVSQLLTVVLIFIFVLVLTYWTTRLAGNYKKQQMAGKNIQVMETVGISASKYLQIVKIGGKYIVIGVSKDTITYLCEINEDELDFSNNNGAGESFKSILEKLKKNGQVNGSEEENS
ncbi:MAG: flagellar biosynthetic protein FliO [Alistipes sp.]|nr:flagellar biosynthetic protein FliO [Alistipes sp.]